MRKAGNEERKVFPDFMLSLLNPGDAGEGLLIWTVLVLRR
jgi:hypothetical protein